MKSPTCLIPARGGSKRFPRKNIAPLLGKPVLAYAIEAATASGLFERVWVSTEDEEIRAVAERYEASIHPREPALVADTATVVQVCLSFADWREAHDVAFDFLCVILPTAALLQPTDLQGGFRLFRERQADFVMAVTSFLETPFAALQELDGYLRPFFGAEWSKRMQELPSVWVDSGYFYFARIEALRRERTFYGKRVLGYPIPRDRSMDIDTPEHLRMAEALLAYHQRSG